MRGRKKVVAQGKLIRLEHEFALVDSTRKSNKPHFLSNFEGLTSFLGAFTSDPGVPHLQSKSFYLLSWCFTPPAKGLLPPGLVLYTSSQRAFTSDPEAKHLQSKSFYLQAWCFTPSALVLLTSSAGALTFRLGATHLRGRRLDLQRRCLSPSMPKVKPPA